MNSITTGDKLSVRELRWEDMEDCVENYYSYFDELRDNEDLGLVLSAEKPSLATEVRWFAELYSAVLEQKAFACVAVAGGKVVGMCEVRRRDTRPALFHTATLGIAVRRGFRGRGAGEMMLRWSLARCTGRFEVIYLTVFSTNTEAKRLYEKVGFRVCGIRPKAIKRGSRYFDEVEMAIELPSAKEQQKEMNA